MSNEPVHRKDFTLPNSGHFFIQQASERDTNHFQLGQEHRFADNAVSVDETITVHLEDAPDLMDAIADHRELPRYTDLLATYDALQYVIDRLNSPAYSSGVFKGAIVRELNMALKGETVE